MRNEFTAIIERDENWYIAFCPEIPGANGQGKTQAEARGSLAEAIALILVSCHCCLHLDLYRSYEHFVGLLESCPTARRSVVNIKSAQY